MQNLRKLARCESGVVHAASYVVLVVIIGLGMLVGVSSFRDQLVQEFGDIALSLENLNQSFTLTISVPLGTSQTSSYTDLNERTGTATDDDAVQTAADDNPSDPASAAPAGIVFTTPGPITGTTFSEGTNSGTFTGSPDEDDPIPTP